MVARSGWRPLLGLGLVDERVELGSILAMQASCQTVARLMVDLFNAEMSH